MLLINEENPDIVCIQETHFSHNVNPNSIFYPKEYIGYFSNLPNIQTSKQGVGILIKQYIPHKAIDVITSISTIVLKINLKYSFSLINTYIPPQQHFSEIELNYLFSQFSSPILWTGDFNSWSPLWGSKHSNRRGMIMENFILQHQLLLLNNCSPTHFSTHSSFSHVDLSFISPQLKPRTFWNISSVLRAVISFIFLFLCKQIHTLIKLTIYLDLKLNMQTGSRINHKLRTC